MTDDFLRIKLQLHTCYGTSEMISNKFNSLFDIFPTDLQKDASRKLKMLPNHSIITFCFFLHLVNATKTK